MQQDTQASKLPRGLTKKSSSKKSFLANDASSNRSTLKPQREASSLAPGSPAISVQRRNTKLMMRSVSRSGLD